MEDEPVVRIVSEFLGHKFQELALDFVDGLAGCQPGTVGDTENMRVDGDGCMSEGRVEHHIGGLRMRVCGAQPFEYGAALLRIHRAMGADTLSPAISARRFSRCGSRLVSPWSPLNAAYAFAAHARAAVASSRAVAISANSS